MRFLRRSFRVCSLASLGLATAVGVAAASQTLPDVGEYPMALDDNQQFGTTEIRVAEAALAVLEASVSAKRVDAILLGGDEKPLSRSEASEALAALAKPLQCSATVERNILRIACGEISDDYRTLYRQRLLEGSRGEGIFSDIGTADPNTASVLLLAGKTVRLTPSELQAWYRDYFVAGQVGLGVREATAEERENGIALVVEASQVESYTGPIPP
jgi:hypothetical protein